MKTIKRWILPILTLGLLGCLSSCSEMDDYKEFTEGGEISYTEKIDSLKVFSGRNRAKIQGIITADPKISEYRIFWNSNRDSVSVPVERDQGIDTLTTIIEGLAENIYNFEVRTLDDLGNKSIPVYTTGEVFGERFQNSLTNRPVVSNTLIGNDLTINYAGMDLTSGVIGTEVDYTNVDSQQETIFIPIDSTSIFLENFLGGSQYQYRTVFLPNPTALDTFYTDYVAYTPQFQISEVPYFKNATYPFERAEWDGNRWGTPAEWIHNSAALSHNGYGAMDNDIFDIEAGWGQPAINNGKVYQTFVLEPGTYAYVININETNYEAIDAKDKTYFIVAKGSTLPDVDNIESSSASLKYERVNKENGMSRSLIFTISEVTQVSVGIAATLPDAGVGRYLKINSFSLGSVSEPPYLQNNSFPFEAVEDGGRWATPAHWVHNEGALSHAGFGAMDGNAGDRFSLESGWESPDIINGKVYQVLMLEPGTYAYNIVIAETNYEGETNTLDKAYFTVATGPTLPDVDDVETSANTLVYERINQELGLAPSLQFTLTEMTQIAIGVQTTNDEGAGRYLKINSFSLTKE